MGDRVLSKPLPRREIKRRGRPFIPESQLHCQRAAFEDRSSSELIKIDTSLAEAIEILSPKFFRDTFLSFGSLPATLERRRTRV